MLKIKIKINEIKKGSIISNYIYDYKNPTNFFMNAILGGKISCKLKDSFLCKVLVEIKKTLNQNMECYSINYSYGNLVNGCNLTLLDEFYSGKKWSKNG